MNQRKVLVEGMRKAGQLNLFRGFSIGSEPIVIYHLQYADDTLCIGETSVENLWTLKAILRGFELTSGLKVNFWKSGLIGINVPSAFLSMACTFLNCRLDSIPFKYLGLPIGANPKSLSTWDPLVEHLRNRLCSWRNKHISLGGRVVMINAVLNAIPVFYLSFLKMPRKVWKKVVRIQREFLWGGVRGGNKINWVRWSVVCKEKKKGGLGVRDIRLVNISLLSKWRWRLLSPGRSLWKEVLVARYGNHIIHNVDWSGNRFPISASSWWKDICSLDKVVESKNWLVESVIRKLELRVEDVLEEDARIIFEKIWESPAPSKVIAFSWQLLYDRIPTRSNLEIRWMLITNKPWECVGCVGSVESSTHLFLHYPSALMVWYEVFRWLGVVIVIPPSLSLLFKVLRGVGRNEKIQKGFVMIWHATLWSLWKARNDSIFANGLYNPKVIVDEVKVLSWKWFVARLKVPPCL
ncbi:uncharacterized protein LOC123904036 [Trifolium pratense]|uniref:uncharacterized protein LOC123904036 n=1 Tax=Trifolium pratense TaxID=57577 RepID=UPI001E694811|nr:uncharacterized protein LOC123904036 [Trifolium pratense]